MYCTMFCNISMCIQCTLNVYSICIQCVFNVYSMSIQCVFNIYSMYNQCMHSMFSNICIFRIMILTHLLSYPNSRDAIASKNKLHEIYLFHQLNKCIKLFRFWLGSNHVLRFNHVNLFKLRIFNNCFQSACKDQFYG